MITAKDLKNKTPRILMVGVMRISAPFKVIFTCNDIILKVYMPHGDYWWTVSKFFSVDELIIKFCEEAYKKDTDYEFMQLLKSHGINIKMV